MKSKSINMLLLLSNVYDRRDLTNLYKDLKGTSAEALEAILKRLEAQRANALSTVTEEIEKEAARISQEAERERKRREGMTQTATEVTHLLLTRYGLRPAEAVQRLSERLARVGYKIDFSGNATKASVSKWLAELSGKVPRDKLIDSALSLRPSA
jgi:hypothetical protein